MTKSELTIKNVSHENLGIIPDSFRRLGIKMEQRAMIFMCLPRILIR